MLPILLTIPAILATTEADTTGLVPEDVKVDMKVVTPAYLEHQAAHPGCFAEHFKEQAKFVCLAAASDECAEEVRTDLIAQKLELEECNVCSCENGKSHEGEDCQKTATFCKACDDGYELDEETATCKSENTCTCANGVAAEGLACEADATADICASCADFYSLKDDKTCGSAQDLTCPALGRIPFSEVKPTDEFICGPDSECKYECTTCSYKAVETLVVDTETSRRLGSPEVSTSEAQAEDSADSEDSTPEAPATPAAKEECKFPYEYNGNWYNACTTDTARWFAGGKTTPWCGTVRSVGKYFWTSLLGSGWVRCEEKSDCLAKVDPLVSGTADTKSADTKSADTKSTDTKSADTKSTDTKSEVTTSSETEPAVSCEKDADCKGEEETCTEKTCQSTAEPTVTSHAAAQISIAAVLAFALSF